jgi:type VI secretion system protein VasJ
VTSIVDARLDAALAPLPPGAPAPATFREEPDFEALETEIRKLERNGPAAVDWPGVVRQSQEILAGRAKDLSVAAWLTVGLAYTEGLRGLTLGLAILHGLGDQYWDSLIPPPNRARARIGVFEWLITKAVRILPPPDAAPDGDAAIVAHEVLQGLSRLVAEKLPDSMSFGELTRPIRALAEAAKHAQAEQESLKVEQPAQAVAPPTPASNPAPPAPRPPPVSTAPIEMPAFTAPAIDTNAEKAFSTLRENLRNAGLAILATDLSEPRAYLLLRCATWLGITQAPPARTNRTEIMAPPESRRAEFAALRGAGNHQDLILALERFCSGSGIFWLDGQRMSSTLLSGMGARHKSCARTIALATVAFLDRVPGLLDLTFSDGSPFADAATQAWIASETAPAERRSEGNGQTEQPDWEEGLRDARAKMADGKAEEALALLATGANAARDGRARFFWKLAQARLCVEAGVVPIALATLQSLNDLVDHHDLEAWEPAAVAESTALLHRCLMSASKDAAQGRSNLPTDAIEAALMRLVRSDPVMAARALGLGRTS